ncbi:MAG: polysaccharide pyruvyl transferase family protein, partial [Planctomycetota bacterium]
VVRTAESPINDVESAKLLLGETADLHDAESVRTPADALARVAQCRVVVTGAYHNAVFALSMGIPVVGLARGDYYTSKMRGVADMFGVGMTVLDYADADLAAKLRDATLHAWSQADVVAAPLQAKVREQIGRAREAYDLFFNHVSASMRRSTR